MPLTDQGCKAFDADNNSMFSKYRTSVEAAVTPRFDKRKQAARNRRRCRLKVGCAIAPGSACAIGGGVSLAAGAIEERVSARDKQVRVREIGKELLAGFLMIGTAGFNRVDGHPETGKTKLRTIDLDVASLARELGKLLDQQGGLDRETEKKPGRWVKDRDGKSGKIGGLFAAMGESRWATGQAVKDIEASHVMLWPAEKFRNDTRKAVDAIRHKDPVRAKRVILAGPLPLERRRDPRRGGGRHPEGPRRPLVRARPGSRRQGPRPGLCERLGRPGRIVGPCPRCHWPDRTAAARGGAHSPRAGPGGGCRRGTGRRCRAPRLWRRCAAPGGCGPRSFASRTRTRPCVPSMTASGFRSRGPACRCEPSAG